jgi:hypothetical protein
MSLGGGKLCAGLMLNFIPAEEEEAEPLHCLGVYSLTMSAKLLYSLNCSRKDEDERSRTRAWERSATNKG